MKKMNCAIVDDEPLARRLVRVYLEEAVQLEDIGPIEVVEECKEGTEVRNLLVKEPIDLLFLDIQMPGLTGIELVEGLENPPMVIFTTAYENFAVKAFELDVVDYLVKPFSLDRFEKACRKARELFSQKNSPVSSKPDSIFLKTAYEWKKFSLEDILFMEGMKEYVKIHTLSDGASLVYMRMKEIEEKFGENFMRIHKSFVVNLSRVEAVGNNEISIHGKNLPVGRVYKKAVLSHFADQSPI